MFCNGNYTSGTGLMLSPYKKWDRRRDLQGVVMRIAALESVPYITSMKPVQDQPGYFQMEGMFAEVFFALQEIMNFTFTLIQPPDMQWVPLDNEFVELFLTVLGGGVSSLIGILATVCCRKSHRRRRLRKASLSLPPPPMELTV